MHFSRIATTIAVVALSASVLASPAANHVLHEKRDYVPRHWVKGERVDASRVLPMRIGMTQSNLDKGHDLLMEVSDPHSDKYGQHYTAEEVAELFAPSQETVDTIRGWLESAGIAAHRMSVSANKQWMQFDASVEEAERILKTKYHQWSHKGTGHDSISCDEYHVPAHVKEHVDYIVPGLRLLSPKAKANDYKKKRGFRDSSSGVFGGPIIGPKTDIAFANMTTPQLLALCDTAITPACIAAMYNITAPTKAAPGNQLGIFEEGDFYAAEDLVEFFLTLAPQIPATTMPILHGIDGGFAPGAFAGGESDLDFQISYPIIYPQNSVLFQTDDFFYATGLQNSSGIFNTFLDAIDGSYCTYSAYGETGDSPGDPKYPDPNPLGYQGQRQCGVYKPTNVISVSYGLQEDDLPLNYIQRQCSEYMKLGMQGVSVIFASGDSGVAARSTDDNNDDGCLGNGEVYNPDFPAACPYLTAAGATTLTGSAAADEEQAVTQFPSGGGFSNTFSMPSYQQSAVQNYYNTAIPPYKYYNTTAMNNPPESVTKGGVYNRGGRGYPDVAAIGQNVVIFNNGAPTLIGGTSASAPVFASIINRINEERIAVGKKPVGFLNPTLYKNPGAFHDITVGNNSGCGGGFPTAKGWDPVTGLGTPNYPSLLKVFMALA